MNGSVTPEFHLSGCPQLPGVEIVSALRRLGQNRELYFDSLRAFADVHRDTPKRLRRFCLGSDVEALRLLAHTLKGEAGNLGITAVRTAAGQLDAALRSCSEREIAASAEVLADAVARSVHDLQANLPSQAAAMAGTRSADGPAVAAVLATLEGQLADRSLRANDTLDRLEALLAGPEYRLFLAGLRALVVRLRFDEALWLVREEAACHGWRRNGAP